MSKSRAKSKQKLILTRVSVASFAPMSLTVPYGEPRQVEFIMDDKGYYSAVVDAATAADFDRGNQGAYVICSDGDKYPWPPREFDKHSFRRMIATGDLRLIPLLKRHVNHPTCGDMVRDALARFAFEHANLKKAEADIPAKPPEEKAAPAPAAKKAAKKAVKRAAKKGAKK